MVMNRRREWEVMCRCEACRDLVNVVFWVRKLERENRDGAEFSASLEKSTTARLESGMLTHRCGGKLEIFEPMPGVTILEG